MFDSTSHIKCDHVKTSKYGEVIGTPCRVCSHKCDCLHLSESTYESQEAARVKNARSTKKQIQKSSLEDPNNPLRGNNHDFKKRKQYV